jgi:hypothetical protein
MRREPESAHYRGLNRRFQVLNRVVLETGLPRWYIKLTIARRLKRTESSVVLNIKRLGVGFERWDE